MKKYKKERSITLLIMAGVLTAYIVMQAVFLPLDNRFLTGSALLVLIAATFIGLSLPLFSSQGHKEFDGWMFGVLVLLIILAVLVMLQMIFRMYPKGFYDDAFDALAIIALCLAIWQNHIDFVKTNRARAQRSGAGSAVLWTGLSMVAVKGFMIAYKDKKKKR